MLGWPWLVGENFRLRIPPDGVIVKGATLVRRADGLDAALVDFGDRIRLDVQDGRPQSTVEGLAFVTRHRVRTVDGWQADIVSGDFVSPYDERYSRLVEIVAGPLRISAFCKDAAAEREAERIFSTLSLDRPVWPSVDGADWM